MLFSNLQCCVGGVAASEVQCQQSRTAQADILINQVSVIGQFYISVSEHFGECVICVSSHFNKQTSVGGYFGRKHFD